MHLIPYFTRAAHRVWCHRHRENVTLRKDMSTPEESVAADLAGSKFTTVDYALFSLMLVVSVGIGVYSALKGRGNDSTQEYLLGGRKMSEIPVALSILGGVISAISILGTATEVYFFGTQICASLLGFIPGCMLVHEVIVPIFYNLRLVSLNQYIEMRYKSVALRKLMTLCRLLVKFFLMGLYLYAPSLALSTVTHLSTWASMLIMGTICTFYITIGGVKAVVYTDVLQTLLMFGGVLLVVIICCVELGGVNNIWTIADQGSRIEFFNLDPSPFVRHTFWSTMTLGFYIMLSIGLDQPCYQRFASVSTLRIAKRLSIHFVVGLYVLWLVFYFSGLVAYATYRNCDPLTSGRIEKPDQVIPYLVMDKVGHLTGIPGVFVAAVYGGVLSSLSSCGNSIACMIWEDFLKDLPYFRGLSDARATTVVKLLSAATGVSGICLGVLAGKLGNIFHVSHSVSGAILGPMYGVFLAGICNPWVNAKGAVGGFTTAFAYNVWLVVGKFLRGGGSPTRLPLSTDGCPENLSRHVNASVSTFVNSSVSNLTTVADVLLASTTATTTTTAAPEVRSEVKTVYDISYCYSGVSGIILTLVVANLASLCTGPLKPIDLGEGLVNPSCARLHQWLWRILPWGRHHDSTSQNDHFPMTHHQDLPEETTNTTTNSVHIKATDDFSNGRRFLKQQDHKTTAT